MTNDILTSDIDLAWRLLRAGRPDKEIVAALARRGLETAKATRLVEDLRTGKPVKPELASVGRTSNLDPESGAPVPGPALEPADRSSRFGHRTGHRRHSSLRRRRRRTERFWVLGALGLAVTAALVLLVLGMFPDLTRARRTAGADAQAGGPTTNLPGRSSEPAETAPHPAPPGALR